MNNNENDVGRPRTFDTPADLWKMFELYKLWAKDNPWYKKHVLKDGKIVDVPHSRPYTLYDFATFCKISKQGLDNYGSRKDHEEFFAVYARIKTDVSSQRISGALCDIYNANLTARLDGLSDKKDVDATVKNDDVDMDLSNLTDDEKHQFSELIEKISGVE